MKLFLAPFVTTLLLCNDFAQGQQYDQGGGDYDDYQDYQDYADGYQQDNLYANYAEKQEDKLAGGGGGGGWGKTVAFSAAAWFMGGKFHSRRAVKKANKTHQKKHQELYAQYYQDVLTLTQENNNLQQYIDQLSKQHQDSEFEAADLDYDNKVSRAEFNMYKKKYLARHPEMANQFPRFEDFDPDANGLISKAEYDDYYRKMMMGH